MCIYHYITLRSLKIPGFLEEARGSLGLSTDIICLKLELYKLNNYKLYKYKTITTVSVKKRDHQENLHNSYNLHLCSLIFLGNLVPMSR